MRRPLFIALVVVSLLGLIGSSLVWWAPRTETFDSMYPLIGAPYPIEPATFDRLRLGMTKTEVEEAVGEPGGQYEYEGAHPPRWGQIEVGYRPVVRQAGVPYEDLCDGHSDDGYQRFAPIYSWHGKEYWIEVVFDPNERVVGYYLERPRPNWWR